MKVRTLRTLQEKMKNKIKMQIYISKNESIKGPRSIGPYRVSLRGRVLKTIVIGEQSLDCVLGIIVPLILSMEANSINKLMYSYSSDNIIYNL